MGAKKTRKKSTTKITGITRISRASIWDNGYRRLLKFAKREGHALVPQYHREKGFQLGHWVNQKRCQGRKGELSAEKVEALEQVDGWIWDLRATYWEVGYKSLLQYVEREGHAQVPIKYIEDDYNLGWWVSHKRHRKQLGKLPDDKVKALEQLHGWSWDPQLDHWETSYEYLLKFVNREGHSQVPAKHIEDGFKLGPWVCQQRVKAARAQLSEDQIEALEKTHGWSWDARESLWEEGYEHLLAFAKREGHSRVPHKYIDNGYKLGSWVATQRKRREKLSPERKKKLEELPAWCWDLREGKWWHCYEQLLCFSNREGHSFVPHSYIENDGDLGQWVVRQCRNRDRLDNDKIKALEELPAWVWDRGEERYWKEGFDCLVLFIQREGHAGVPSDHVEGDLDLSGWIHEQHVAYWDGTMLDHRRNILEGIPEWRWVERREILKILRSKKIFLEMNSDDQARAVSEVLSGRGSVKRSESVKIIASGLRDTGLADFKRFREDGVLGRAIANAVRRALGRGYLDHPRRGYLRVVVWNSRKTVK
ncbi:MAG: hypothetical protein GY847_28415 [Proteobacteria bacterium]|nr:hypothetical protein [Pseudomonadota bacterium]